jgi:serine/threonine protein kinase
MAKEFHKSEIKHFSCKNLPSNKTNKLTLGDIIGEESVYGTVYEACINDDCENVFKYIPIDWSQTGIITEKMILYEIKIQKKAVGIAPKILGTWKCNDEKNKGIGFAMESLVNTVFKVIENEVRKIMKNNKIKSSNLKNLMPQKLKNLIDEVLKKIKMLHDKDIFHGDAHLNNFMIDKKFNVKIIDYGKSGLITDYIYSFGNKNQLYSMQNYLKWKDYFKIISFSKQSVLMEGLIDQIIKKYEELFEPETISYYEKTEVRDIFNRIQYRIKKAKENPNYPSNKEQLDLEIEGEMKNLMKIKMQMDDEKEDDKEDDNYEGLGGKKRKMKKKKVRKHKGINQQTGRLKKGYKYSGKKLKSGLSQIIKTKS